MHHSEIKADVRKLIADGTVLPAHPLALDANRALDVRHQRALTRYYLDAGAGGLAVGVHTTQFAIRDVGLYRPVLELAAETAAAWTKRPLAMVAGLAGPTQQAIAEAQTARGIGYHAGLLSLAAMKSASEDEIIAHCEAVAREIPLVGFYLQPAVGGVILSADFWRRFAAIDNVIAIKIAPFNRYRTLDVLRGVAAAGALDRVALYTGNDDHILLDLMLPFDLRDKGVTTRAYFKGGLLGHWSVWTASAIKQFEMCKAARGKDTVPADLLALDARVTDCNSAFFDVANNFHGCIAGCHEILRRQGLMQGLWCLDPAEGLSPGQMQRDRPRLPRACRSLRRRLREGEPAEMAGMTADEPFISLRNVRKVYRSKGAEFLAVSDVTMDVSEGELVSLVGPSGCGKTTVLKILAGLHEADGGTIKIGNAKTPFDPARDIGMVFQQALLLKWRTILDNVLLPAEIVGLPMKAARARARDLLNLVGLAGYEDKYPQQLSGGMQQRTAIARAFIHDPKLILMDEPFGALDALTREQMNLEMLRIWRESGKTIMFVTHSIQEAVFLASHCAVLTAGPARMAEYFPIELPFPRDSADQDHGRIRRLCAADLREPGIGRRRLNLTSRPCRHPS